MNKETRLGVLEGILEDAFGNYAKDFKRIIPLLARYIDQAYSVDESKIEREILDHIKFDDEGKVCLTCKYGDIGKSLSKSDEVLKVNTNKGE